MADVAVKTAIAVRRLPLGADVTFSAEHHFFNGLGMAHVLGSYVYVYRPVKLLGPLRSAGGGGRFGVGLFLNFS